VDSNVSESGRIAQQRREISNAVRLPLPHVEANSIPTVFSHLSVISVPEVSLRQKLMTMLRVAAARPAASLIFPPTTATRTSLFTASLSEI
jgi:hypothetical protein